MKQRILIIGSGFAGMWAAVSAARAAALAGSAPEIVVLSPRPELRIRPRFYEDGVQALAADLRPLFAALDIRHIAGSAAAIDPVNRRVETVLGGGEKSALHYDRLIIASGSHLRPSSTAGVNAHTFNIDSMEAAARLEAHLEALANRPASEARNTVVVCGGGFTGIELASELPSRLRALFGSDSKINIVVVEKGDRIAGRFSPGLADAVTEASRALNVAWRLNSRVESVDASGVTLHNGERISAATVVWTAGVTASGLGENLRGERDALGRFMVTPELRLTDYPDIYASGDMVHAKTDARGNTALMTCQHAIQLGKFAGHNAAASLLGTETIPYRQENYVTCLDLGAWGAVYTEGWDQQVKMVRDEAKALKTSITHELIYPPQANREAAFAAADPLAKFV